MNGILVIDKEKGYTSRDVVNIVGKKLNTKKVGHTGTLDPIATGVLVLCVGNCLKLSELLVSDNKEYVAKVRLGIETDTLDITGKVVKESVVNDITRKDVERVLNKFKGRIKQEVPKYSAVKVKGKKLYEYARNDIEVVLPIRDVDVYEIGLLSDVINNEFSFRCKVSKGTYIRSLIRDIGIDLGTYATMTDLRRTKQGIFDVEDAYKLIDLENNNYKLLDPTYILDIPKVIVNENMEFKVRNGQVLKRFFEGDMVMILNKNHKLIAIYKEYKDGYVKPYKIFN